MTSCAKCGAQVDPAAKFCPSCGAVVTAPIARPSAPTTPLPAVTRVAPPVRGARLLQQLREATLGEYEVLAELGSGGMATVFLAHDLQLDRRVAIKLMHPALLTGEGMVERFILEARTSAGLSHPNIIPIYAVRVEEDLLFFVMKFVEGRPLDSIIRKEAPLPADMVRQITSAIADALGYAHQRGVIHRDIKPANIMISTEGQPVLTDFGIAKVADKHGLTMTGATIGTPTYMSPEQCNALPLTGASDQYSLGVMAYEMLAGRPPFDADSVMTIMYKHIHDPPPPIEQRVAGCPPDLARTIDRMLAKEPEARFPEMGEVVRALQRPSTTSEHQVRTQLVQLAMEGENRKVAKRVSTPRSPIPTALERKPRTRVVREPAGQSSGMARYRTPLVAGLLVLGGVAVTLGLTRPWQSEDGARQGAPVATSVADSMMSAEAGNPGEVLTDTLPPTPEPAPAVAARDTTPPGQGPPASRQPRGRTAPPAAPEVAATVSTVRIAGSTSLQVGGSTALQALPLTGTGVLVPGRTVHWTSSAPDVASVNGSGQVTAREPGRAVITAQVDGVSQQITVTVAPEPPSEVAVTPAQVSLSVGESRDLRARVQAASGRQLTQPVQWTSSAPQVAAVDADGQVTAVAPGSATISASAGGVRGTAAVTVLEKSLTEAELRAQVVATIQAYASALQAKDISRVRQLYPAMTAANEAQLRNALPAMENLQVHLTVGQISWSGSTATAQITGNWNFNTGGRATRLPADNTYVLERRGNGYVITNIR